jgi:hypothetical protein
MREQTELFIVHEWAVTDPPGLCRPSRGPPEQDVLDRSSFCDETVVCGLLTELSLYYLIYTESSSMRHTPELLWFLFWCMNHRCAPALEPGQAMHIPARISSSCGTQRWDVRQGLHGARAGPS